MNAEDAQAQGSPAITPVVPKAERVLEFDFPSFEIGVAEYPDGPTGCTVFHFPVDRYPEGVMLEMDARGGAVAPIGDYGATNAICFAGGSVYGLEAATGVAGELFRKSGYRDLIPVSGAIIYDAAIVAPPDGWRNKGIYPDKALGAAAVGAMRTGRFPLGRHGAGSSASAGQWVDFPARREWCGQGGAFRQIGGIKMAVFTVVNALGVVFDRQGQVVRGGLIEETGERPMPIDVAVAILEGRQQVSLQPGTLPPGLTRHTTLTALIINVDLPRELLRQLGRQVHSSMARAIQPFHTPDDGDVLFTASTREISGEGVYSTALGVVASELAWDAVLASFAPGTE